MVERLPSRADEAMSRYAEGDEAAFAIIYDELAPRLGGYLHRLCRDPHLTEDLLQQTFLQIHDARGRFTPGAAVAPWAYAIARRLFLDANERRARLRDRQVSLEDAGELPNPGEATPEAIRQGQEAERLVEEALAAMPENQRAAFLLVKGEGLSMQEAASILGTTITTVKLRAHRAYERLRAALADKEPGSDALPPPP